MIQKTWTFCNISGYFVKLQDISEFISGCLNLKIKLEALHRPLQPLNQHDRYNSVDHGNDGIIFPFHILCVLLNQIRDNHECIHPLMEVNLVLRDSSDFILMDHHVYNDTHLTTIMIMKPCRCMGKTNSIFSTLVYNDSLKSYSTSYHVSMHKQSTRGS